MDPSETLTPEPKVESSPEFEKNDTNQTETANSDSGTTADSTEVSNKSFRDTSQNYLIQEGRDFEEENDNGNFEICKTSCTELVPEVSNNSDTQNEQPAKDGSVNGNAQILCDSTDPRAKRGEIDHSTNNGKISEAIVRTSKPLCADYRSDSDSDSVDSESDSSSTSSDSSDASSDGSDESDESHNSNQVQNTAVKEEKKLKGDLLLAELPPIENLKITVPEDACVEVGKITSIVETLVIVESYKGTSALDVDTVLFLDRGKQTLGKVFDILGPVSEPVYAVRFNNEEQINSLNITKDMKVYYAPKTEHTTFVFMSEVLKNRGSDASWKDNVEAPPEFQDFSDDEEERLHKNKHGRDPTGEKPVAKDQNASRKRPFNVVRPTTGVVVSGRFRPPNFSQQRQYVQRNPSAGPFASRPPFPASNFRNPVQVPPYPYGAPSYSRASPLSVPPQVIFPPRISGPPFPAFGGLPFVRQGQNFQQPYHQQRTHAFHQTFGSWGRAVFRPPPPPPPPAE